MIKSFLKNWFLDFHLLFCSQVCSAIFIQQLELKKIILLHNKRVLAMFPSIQQKEKRDKKEKKRKIEWRKTCLCQRLLLKIELASDKISLEQLYMKLRKKIKNSWNKRVLSKILVIGIQANAWHLSFMW